MATLLRGAIPTLHELLGMENLQLGMLLFFGSTAVLSVALLVTQPGHWLRALIFFPVGLLGLFATLRWITRSRRPR